MGMPSALMITYPMNPGYEPSFFMVSSTSDCRGRATSVEQARAGSTREQAGLTHAHVDGTHHLSRHLSASSWCAALAKAPSAKPFLQTTPAEKEKTSGGWTVQICDAFLSLDSIRVGAGWRWLPPRACAMRRSHTTSWADNIALTLGMAALPAAMLGLAVLAAGASMPPALDCSDPEAAGRALQDEGLWTEAAAQFQRALEECGDDAGVYSALGQAKWQLGRAVEAIPAFRRAVDMDPQNPFFVYNLGSLLHWEGEDLTAAEIALEKAAQLSEEQGANAMLAAHAWRARDRCRAAAALRIQREKIELELGEDAVAAARAAPLPVAWRELVARETAGEVTGTAFFKSVGPLHGHVVPVEERNADELSYDEFMREFALKSRPVVIRGLVKRITRDNSLWDADYIVEKCGDHTIIPRVFDKASTKWAGLEDEPAVSVSPCAVAVRAPARPQALVSA